MRKPPLVPTKRQRVLPAVLLVGSEPGLFELCQICADFAASARVVISDVAGMSTKAAQWRPFAIVVPISIHEFDPTEFAALARSVNAELITVSPERIPDALFKNDLITAFRDALRRRARSK